MTTDVKIDAVTGLPELPEKHYWLVEKDRVQIIKSTDTWTSWREAFVRDPKEDRLDDFERARIIVLRDSSSVSEDVEKFQIRTRIERRKQFSTNYRKQKRLVVEYSYLIQRRQFIYTDQSEKVPFFGKDPASLVTPENLVEYATKAYLAWQAKLAEETEQKRRAAIYGAYPPKTASGLAAPKAETLG